MRRVSRMIVFDVRKILSSRIWWIGVLVLLIGQPLFALVEAKQIASIGVTATPQTHPELLGALPPVAFMGFDVTPFGEVVVIILGALLGSSEYSYHELRLTFLAAGSRLIAFVGKVIAFVGLLAIVSLLVNYLTLVFTQIGLGQQGINPIILTAGTWGLLGKVVGVWTVFALISWTITMMVRHWLVAVLLLVPQAVGFGDQLVHSWSLARYLPVVSGHCLIVIPPQTCMWQTSAMVGLTLITIVLVVAAMLVLIRRDVGAR